MAHNLSWVVYLSMLDLLAPIRNRMTILNENNTYYLSNIFLFNHKWFLHNHSCKDGSSSQKNFKLIKAMLLLPTPTKRLLLHPLANQLWECKSLHIHSHLQKKLANLKKVWSSPILWGTSLCTIVSNLLSCMTITFIETTWSRYCILSLIFFPLIYFE